MQPEPNVVSPERRSTRNKSEDVLNGDSSDTREPVPVYTKKDLEQLKGIFQKDELITKEDKNSLPITKYTEQRHDALKMLVGWEGRGMKRFLEIKCNIKKFKLQHEATFQEMGGQSLVHMVDKMRGCHEWKNQRLTQYAKSEEELKRKQDIEKAYDEEDLSPFAGNGNMQVWGI